MRTKENLVSFLQDFARPEDLTPENQEDTDIRNRTRLSFLRGDFVPSEDSPMSQSLYQYERGEAEAFEQDIREIERQVGLQIEMRLDPLIEGPITRIVKEIILIGKEKVLLTFLEVPNPNVT